MITEKEPATSGEFKIGDTVLTAYVEQSRDTISPDKTVWEVISDGQDTITLGNRQFNSRAYAARSNFSGIDQQKKWEICQAGKEIVFISLEY